MTENFLEKILMQLGLSAYEIRAYSSLVSEGQLKAIDISKFTNIPQSKIYAVLGLLEMRGLIEACPGFPKEYKAVSPMIATKRLLDLKEKKIKDLKEEIEKTLPNIIYPSKKLKTFEEKIWTVSGKESFPSKAFELLKKSKESFLLFTLNFTMTPEIEKEFKNAIKRGIECRIIGCIDENTASKAYKYMKIGFKVKHLKHGFIRFAVLDKKFVLFRLKNSKTGEYTTVSAENNELAEIFTELFSNLWKKSEKSEDLLRKYLKN